MAGIGLRSTFIPAGPFPRSPTSLPPANASLRNTGLKCSIRQGRPRTEAPVARKEHHLWMRRDPTGSGQKALHLVRIVSKLPNEKEALYEALNKWSAWETEFPLIAAAKALEILRKRGQWLRIIQIFADMEELGVRPDENTVRRVGKAFLSLGQEDKQKQVLQRYGMKWKYIHFNGERVRARTSM